MTHHGRGWRGDHGWHAPAQLQQIRVPAAGAAGCSGMTFKAYLVEDSPLIRENLVGFLHDVADANVVACASSEEEAVHWLRQHRDDWDLTIVDLFLEHGNGLGVVRACRH